MPAEV